MNDIITLILTNLEKVGIGAGMFLCAYLANIFLGIWSNVKIEGNTFDWRIIGNSVLKFVFMGLGIAFLSIVVSAIPAYATYIGIEIGAETMETIDSLVVVGAFMTATIRYVTDAIIKLKTILGN